MAMKKRKTMTDILREATTKDGRTIYELAKEANIPYPVLYRFLEGDKNGHRQGLTLTTADKLAEIIGFELVRKKSQKSR